MNRTSIFCLDVRSLGMGRQGLSLFLSVPPCVAPLRDAWAASEATAVIKLGSPLRICCVFFLQWRMGGGRNGDIFLARKGRAGLSPLESCLTHGFPWLSGGLGARST